MRHPRAALDAYVDGELQAAPADRVAAHLLACPGCRDRAFTTVRVRASLRAMAERSAR